MKYLKNRTFSQSECPKSTIRLFEFVSIFKEALFQFNSFFMLLYIQLASPIAQNVNFTSMFFFISMALIFSKILAGFCWSISSHFLETGKFKYGRYRSMTFIGFSLSTLFSFLTFFIAPLCGTGWSYVIAFLIFYTCSECVFSINDIAYWSYINKMSYDEGKRSRILGVTNTVASIGSYLITALSPAISAGNAKQNMTILMIVLLCCFFVSHVIYCLLMYEKADDISIDLENNGKLFESLRIMFTDKQVFLVVISFFLIFVSQDLIAGNTSAYFYYEYGYGGFSSKGYDGTMSGGFISFVFSLCFGLMVCFSNIVYPSIVKKTGKKNAMTFSMIMISALYLLLYFFGMIRGREIILFVLIGIIGFFHGIILLVLNVNVCNVAEYYEAKTGKERSASIQAAKALAVKTANGIQTGFFYLFLAISPNLLDINRQVANLESLNNRGELESDIIDEVNTYIHGFENIEDSLSVYRISITILPMVLTALAVILAYFVYVTNEEKYKQYVEEVKRRKEENTR